MNKHIAIYVRVSSRRQDTRSQELELQRWVDAQGVIELRWYRDAMSGTTMDRPGWKRLEEAIAVGLVTKVVVWRLDRLGRTAAGLTALFEEFHRRKIGFESLKDKVDLSTPAGRLMANVLASVAAFENEIRSERIIAGQAAARAQGKVWGGSAKGIRKKVTGVQTQVIKDLRLNGTPISRIAQAVGLSRPTIYSVLETACLDEAHSTESPSITRAPSSPQLSLVGDQTRPTNRDLISAAIRGSHPARTRSH
jgi:DNA invertase Pin-like site-specific DNA recombinase